MLNKFPPLRELLYDAFEGKIPWDQFLQSLAKYTLKGDRASEWRDAVMRERSPNLLLLSMGLRLLDAGHITAEPPRARKPKLEDVPGDEITIEHLKGAGPKTVRALAREGIETLEDLVHLYPRGYESYRRVSSLEEIGEDEDVIVTVEVTSFSMYRGRRAARAIVTDGRSTAVLQWVRAHMGLSRTFRKGARITIAGRPKRSDDAHAWVFFHPKVLGDEAPEIRPVYPEIKGVAESRLHSLILQAIPLVSEEILPPSVLRDAGLMPREEAYRWIHSPPPDIAPSELEKLREHTHPAWARLHYEEIFAQQVALMLKKREWQERTAPVIPQDRLDEVVAVFPFELTRGQRRAIEDIVRDLGSGTPMRRLLQGDVGSGKTAVAFSALALTALSGRQGALMVPTTLLAEQHARTMEPWVQRLGLTMRLITSETPRSVKESILALVRAGEVDILVGTHALIQEKVLFRDLALVVVDEQHRFGVAQRARLTSKGAAEPHLLVMTATPIPRSLALSVYGDLELTIIPDLPPGRVPVRTEVAWSSKDKMKVFSFLDSELARGKKAFVVAPLIEESEELDRLDVERVSKWIAENLANARMGVVHGRMRASEREDTVRRFREGELNLLVATTVIEVGLDIPDAAYMVILDADTFGLAQLHQLRGRIGRSPGLQAVCWLFASTHPSREGRQRLAIMAAHTDGFRIAEQDMEMRGPGEILGTKQAGRDAYEAIVLHGHLIPQARRAAEELIRQDPELASYPALRRRVLQLLERGVFGEESG